MISPNVVSFGSKVFSVAFAGCLLASAAPGQSPATVPSGTNTSAAADAEAEKAWKDLQRATRPPMTPAEWQGHPSQEQVQEFRAKNAVLAEEAADKAKDFYTRFPNHPKAADAHKKELDMLRNAEMLGSTNKSAALAALEEQRLNDPKLSEKERLDLRMKAFQRSVMSKQSEGHEAML